MGRVLQRLFSGLCLVKSGGVRIEDNILVTGGEPENLTAPVMNKEI